MLRNRSVWFLFLVGFLIFLIADESTNGEKKESSGSKPSVDKLADGTYKIGSVILNRDKGEIYINGEVNMQSGMIELLACAWGGKQHESVLVLDVVPHHLQVALLLLGLEPGERKLEYQGDPGAPEGDSLEVWVEWKQDRKTKRVRGEDLVYNISQKRAMKHTHWVFTGSVIYDGRFLADEDKSIITTFHDPLTIIDNPLTTGGDDTIYEVNKELVPKVGTPVKVILKALGGGK